MSVIQGQVKEIMVRGLKEILHPHQSTKSDNEVRPQSSFETDIVFSRNFSKSIRYFVEHSLMSDIDSHLKEIGNTNKETWKIDAHNLSKVLLDHSKLSCVQDNLSNILDSCLKEVNDPNFKYSNDSELYVSPLLQPEHITEIAECMSTEKPLDIRLNALRVLLKSHLTDAINGEGWLLLQKKLVESLCDNNIEIFVACMKVHAKLVSSCLSTAIKECALNVMDSLTRQYCVQYSENTVISIQSKQFYRMVYLTHLLLATFKEATLNVARFGESKLCEVIDNLIQLMSINFSSKQSSNNPFPFPLEVVSYLDPNGKWLVDLTHFTLTRQLFFSSLYQNIGFLRITIEEIVDWLTEPAIPSRNISRVSQGELNVAIHKYSLFCHSLSVFTIICSYSNGRNLFPVRIKRNEDLLSVEDVVKMLITSLNDARFNDILHTNGTDMFRTLLAQNISKLLCLKEINGSSYLWMLMSNHDNQEQLSPIKMMILDIISQYEHSHNPFFHSDMPLRKKIPMFSHCFMSNLNSSTNQNSGSMKHKREIEHQSSVHLSVDAGTNETFPFEIYIKLMVDKLKGTNVKELPQLIQIATRLFKNFEKVLNITYVLRAQTTQLVAEIYIKLQVSFQNPDSKLDNDDINLSGHCLQFLLHAAATPLGFHALQVIGVVVPLLLDKLQSPIINWSDPAWLLFASRATTINEGCGVLAAESRRIVAKELTQLWDVIDEDCSGSQLPVKDASDKLLRVVANLTLNLGGVKAILKEPRDGSEVTLTEEYELRPLNIYFLIQHFALSAVNCPTFIHHQFALSVLEMLISNIDSRLYLQHQFKYEDILLQLQSDSRVDENSDVIIDECSLLRHKIIQQTYLPCRVRVDAKPTHTAPRPESTLTRGKPRSRGAGELARWLSETRLGLHDHSWLKHARKLYRNSGFDDMKGSTIIDLLEQVARVLPETKATIKWQIVVNEDIPLEPEEQLAVQLVMRYGAHHRLIQPTQQNSENLSHLVLLLKTSLNQNLNTFEGFDWFVASAFLICSGNIEKSQGFLSLMSALPTAPLLWLHLSEPSVCAQMGNVLETIITEEMPDLYQLLQAAGLSWWQLCCSWINQCWWNILDWPQICHWFTLSILHQLDYPLYFCVALLHANHDRLHRMAQQGTIYEITVNPVDKFHLADARVLIEKLHKKYHNTLHSHLSSL